MAGHVSKASLLITLWPARSSIDKDSVVITRMPEPASR